MNFTVPIFFFWLFAFGSLLTSWELQWSMSAGCQLSCAQSEEHCDKTAIEWNAAPCRWALGVPAGFVFLLSWLPVWDKPGSSWTDQSVSADAFWDLLLPLLLEMCTMPGSGQRSAHSPYGGWTSVICLCSLCFFPSWLQLHLIPCSSLLLMEHSDLTSLPGCILQSLHLLYPHSLFATKWVLGRNVSVSVIWRFVHFLFYSCMHSLCHARQQLCGCVSWTVWNSFLLQMYKIWDTNLCQEVV